MAGTSGSDAVRVVRSKLLCLLVLYFVQGIPYGFQARFLPIFLRSRGASLTSLGLFKTLLLPWMLKVLWAPLLERHATRRTNLICSLVAMATVCGFMTCISPDWTASLCAAIFMLNLSASIQDIAVDAIAISILSESELGAGNTVQVVGYKVGSIFGGGVLIWLIAYMEWSGLFVLLTLLYLVTLVMVTQLGELRQYNEIGKGSDIANGNGLLCENGTGPLQESDSNLQAVSVLVREVVNTPHTKWIMLFALFYKLGEQGAVGMFPLYLVDHGIPVSEVGFLTGVISQGLSIAGSLAGGWMLSKSELNLTPAYLLPYLMKLRLVPLVLQTAVICSNVSDTSVPLYGLCALATCFLQLIGGAVTIVTFTLMMQCSQHAPLRIQATHYTALATLEVMGKLMFMSVAGWFVDWLGYGPMFCLFVALSVCILAMFRPGFKSKLV